MTEETLAGLSISTERMEEQIPVFNNSGHTHIKEVQCNYTWTVRGFSNCPEERGQYFTSPTFSVGINDKYKWCILLYPKGDSNQLSINHLSLSLQFLSGDESEVQAKYKFSILNKMGEKINTKEVTTYSRFSKLIKCTYGWPAFIPINTLQKDALLSDDKLIILCEIGMIERVSIPNHSSAAQVIISEWGLLDDLTQIFENQEFSDVTLVAKGKEFQAHKVLLAARSPVFKAMFKHEMQEKKHNRIEIDDVDSEIVLEMLRFMYTGKVKNLENIAIDLLPAADKYALERLKSMCEEILCSNNPTIENAVKVLIVADLHMAKLLKAHTKKFIIMHSKDVMGTPAWKSMAHHPGLLEELFTAVTEYIAH